MVASFFIANLGPRTRFDSRAKLAEQFLIHDDEIATILGGTIDKPEKN